LGDGLVLVDPHDVEAIAAGLAEAAARKGYLGRSGEAVSAAYSWARVGRETLSVYREVAG
jgi:glycosyltransferase involved in cell wall biosynthesis